MLAKSHMLSSMVIAVPLLAFVSQEQTMVFLLAVLLGSLFPDLDEPGSYLSRKVYIVSLVISVFTTHRGVTHTLFIVALYAAIGILIIQQYEFAIYAVVGFILGNIAHFLGDMTTKSGLAIFYPFFKNNFYILPKSLRIRTGSSVERFIIIPLMGGILSAELYFLATDITSTITL